MRSVNKKPLTMFVIDANTATAPRIVLKHGSCSPASMIDPTTAMAEIALVNDIRGVCSSRETLRITSSPVNVANISTYNSVRKSAFAALSDAASRIKGWGDIAWLVLSVRFSFFILPRSRRAIAESAGWRPGPRGRSTCRGQSHRRG